jgi:hypothetical protein
MGRTGIEPARVGIRWRNAVNRAVCTAIHWDSLAPLGRVRTDSLTDSYEPADNAPAGSGESAGG